MNEERVYITIVLTYGIESFARCCFLKKTCTRIVKRDHRTA